MGGKNVEQHVPQLAFTAAGFIGRQVAHQRLGMEQLTAYIDMWSPL